MSKLTSGERNHLKTSQFAGPDRSYPVPDASHAKNAKARASQMEHEVRISKSEEERIDAKADRVLGRKRMPHEKFHDHMADKLTE